MDIKNVHLKWTLKMVLKMNMKLSITKDHFESPFSMSISNVHF